VAAVLTFGMASSVYFEWLLLGFCIVYGLSALVNFITLPTEFDASHRGKQLLDQMQVVENGEERVAVSQVLRAAANTYVVTFAMSLLYFLRYLSYFMILFGKKRD
jgi:Zn-dependent membrane protease YugP